MSFCRQKCLINQFSTPGLEKLNYVFTIKGLRTTSTGKV